MKITLRYFPVIGRAQPLRHALFDSQKEFHDLQITLPEWSAHKEDPGFAGIFSGLPTLSWGEDTICETLAISSFLARRLGHYQGLSDAGVSHLEAVCSNCYTEVLLRLGELIWADLIYQGQGQGQGANVAAALPMLLGRMLDKMSRLEATASDAGWFGRSAPSMADFFAAEAVEALLYLQGEPEALRQRLPRLVALSRRIRERPSLAAAFAARPAQFTVRPDEAAVIARLRAAMVT